MQGENGSGTFRSDLPGEEGEPAAAAMDSGGEGGCADPQKGCNLWPLRLLGIKQPGIYPEGLYRDGQRQWFAGTIQNSTALRRQGKMSQITLGTLAAQKRAALHLCLPGFFHHRCQTQRDDHPQRRSPPCGEHDGWKREEWGAGLGHRVLTMMI